MKALLEAGVHFGHQTRRWNPKMKPYIFGARNGIHIIDLQQTMQLFKEATDFVTDSVRQGKMVLFVGTKRQAQDAVREEAERCEMYYINNRWLGGLLTNWQTVSSSLQNYKDLEAMKESNYENQISKKAITRLERRRRKLEKNLVGIKQMERLPDAIVVIDPNKEQIAVKEARKMNIPVVALVDTNCDPEEINYVIPGNDDALRSVRLIVSKLADAVIEGVEMRKQEEEMVAKQEAEEAAEAELEVKVPETPVDKSEDELKPARAYVSEDDNAERDRRGGKAVRRRKKEEDDN
jgi:small subunit ribosomal protein S2